MWTVIYDLDSVIEFEEGDSEVHTNTYRVECENGAEVLYVLEGMVRNEFRPKNVQIFLTHYAYEWDEFAKIQKTYGDVK